MTFHRLDLGSLDLVNADIPAEGFYFETLVDGFSLGSPEAIVSVQSSLMADGEDERWERDSNREITFTVVARGPDLAALADAERALRLELYRRNELAWTPPDGYGETTVFDVMTSRMDLVPISDTWDLQEAKPGVKERAYAVTLRCLPHGRSPVPVTQTLAAAAVSPTIIDDCSTTANWSKAPFSGEYPTIGTGTIGGESVVQFSTLSINSSSYGVSVIWSGAKPTTAYVTLDVEWSGFGSGVSVALYAGNGYYPPVASEQITLGSARFTRYYFLRPTVAGNYTFSFDGRNPDGGQGVGSHTVRVGNVGSSDQVAQTGVMSVATVGSVRAPGSVRVSRATNMPWLFLYADPQLDQFSPRIPATWSSGRAGTYVVYASNGFSNNDLIVTTVTVAGKPQSMTTRIDTEVGALTWQPVGEFDLGGRRDGLLGTITVAMTKNGAPVSSPNLRLFRLADDTSLTLLSGMTSTTSIEVLAPSVDFPSGGFWANGSAVEPQAGAFPTIVVPRTSLFAETSAGADPTVALEYHPRFHTYNAYAPDAA